jgi:hypothetical protein
LYLVVFGLLLLFHVVVFRDVIAAIPSVLRGDASIVREELVPFFNFKTQFWGEETSALTSSEEVRVSYSFWTAWMRYDKVLPFALIFLNTVSAFLLFCAFWRLGKYVYKRSLFGAAAALLATLLIHTILLYSKVAHFYVLIIGFGMFALSLSLLIEQVFFKLRLSKQNVLAVSGLTLFNPAIHYHVIFYVVAALIIGVHSTFTFVMNRRYFWKYFRRGILYLALLVLCSLVPYVIYIFLTTSSSISSVSTQIPVNYWMIYYASLSLPYIFSLDTAGHLDLIRYGNYLAPIPRFGSITVMLLVGSLFMYRRWKTLHIVIKAFIIMLFIVMLFAMWMTIGYSQNSPYSFHDALGAAALFFTGLGGIGATIAGLLGTFINILRFPHRFQFIYFYAAGLLFMIALVWLREVLMRRQRMVVASCSVGLIALFPLYANYDYRTALTSGDLATFAAPYPIPSDLKNIKAHLAAQSTTKLFILPTLEGGREIITNGKSYSFIDKYLIYYLNQPTYYYGAGANTDNKLLSYLVYRSIAYNEPWWQDILADNLGITDVLVPVQAKQRDQGIAYLPGIEGKIKASLGRSDRYKKTVAGHDYELYSLTRPRTQNVSLMVDAEWHAMLEQLNRRSTAGIATFFPLQMKSYASSSGTKKLLTDSVERSFYDFYQIAHTKATSVPNPASLPFSPEYVASSNFTNNTLSLSTLYAKKDDYNYLHEKIPSLVNLQRPSFIGLTKGKVGLPVHLTVPRDGTYRLALHAASQKNQVHATIGGQNITLEKIKSDRRAPGDYIDFSYYYADVSLKGGRGLLTLQNTDTNAVVIDALTLIPQTDIPHDFTHIQTPGLAITPTDKPSLYDVHME